MVASGLGGLGRLWVSGHGVRVAGWWAGVGTGLGNPRGWWVAMTGNWWQHRTALTWPPSQSSPPSWGKLGLFGLAKV